MFRRDKHEIGERTQFWRSIHMRYSQQQVMNASILLLYQWKDLIEYAIKVQ